MGGFSKLLLDFLEAFNTVSQFLLSAVGIVGIFLVFSMKYVIPIVKILRPLGFKYRKIFIILLLCRKDPKTKIRCFIEFSIIKTNGKYKDSNTWNKIINDFELLLKSGKYLVQVDNCAVLANENINDYLNQYYIYFSKRKQKYAIAENCSFKYVMQIEIKQGFLSPYISIGNSLSTYEDSWPILVKKYVSMDYKKENILPDEISSLFGWLIWGPSYKLYNQEKSLKICQYSFGDEGNSIVTFMGLENTDEKLWDEVNNNSHAEGLVCSITCDLYNKNEFITNQYNKFNKKYLYFVDKMYHNEIKIAPSINSIELASDYHLKNYYSTAYIWIVFESFEDEPNDFIPNKTMAFIENANMSDKDNYAFLTKVLIDKSFAYFDQKFSDEKYKKRKYRYCLSVNKDIENEFKKQLELNKKKSKYKNDYKKRVILDDKYTEKEVLMAFENYFSLNKNLDYIEVDINNKKIMEDFGRFFSGIYMPAFPNPDERESYENIIYSLEKKNSKYYGKNNYHILLVKNESEVLGGIIAYYFAKTNSAIIEYIAIDEEKRSSGIGTHLYNNMIKLLNKDAKKNGHNKLAYIFAEIENPNILNKISLNDIHFWNKLFFRNIKFNYIQPPLDSDKKEVDYLYLATYSFDTNNEFIEKKILKSFLIDFAKYGSRIEKPLENKFIKKMVAKLDKLGEKIETEKFTIMKNKKTKKN